MVTVKEQHRSPRRLVGPADAGGRRLYWWRMPVRPDRTREAGEGMLVAVGVWLASVVAVAIVIGALVT